MRFMELHTRHHGKQMAGTLPSQHPFEQNAPDDGVNNAGWARI